MESIDQLLNTADRVYVKIKSDKNKIATTIL